MRAFTIHFDVLSPGAAMRLTRRSTAALLVFGLSMLLIHLGDTRVLTRHEVLSAQPAREMLHAGTLKAWLLPTLAGLPRQAKPPGMMWLIAASMYVFRSDAEWVARLPSALAGLWVALMIARLAARWFGDRIGRLAGLMQLTFVYTITQAKLSEIDMALTAAVCCALCALAAGVIDSPAGVDVTRKSRLRFWLAIAAAFLLKGPIGLIFVGLTAAAFAIFQRDARLRILRFLADPIGIPIAAILMIGWPLAAWSMDPNIVKTWHSEAIGTATGTFGSDPFYYYVWSVPFMMLPWTPFAILGFYRGPNAELAGAVVSQQDRQRLWRFLLCWFVPGFLFLSLGMSLKSHHYAFPVLPPLTIPAALGMDYFIRRQMTLRPQRFVEPIFLVLCGIGIAVVWKFLPLSAPMKHAVILLIALFAAGGLLALRMERARHPGLMKLAYFATAWAIAVGVQTWAMPAQDDFRFQADFAREVNGHVPPGVTIYMLGAREEEQEAEYAYYLRFPMQRLVSLSELPKSDQPIYAIAPAGLMPAVKPIAVCDGLRAKETEADRLVLLRIVPSAVY